MLCLLLTFFILQSNAEQPVIQYDTIEPAHLTTPHVNKLRLEKHLVILPKVSHEVQYLSNQFRRDADTTNHDALMQNIKPVTEDLLEPPSSTAPITASLQTAPTKGIFSNLNLNYEVPSYSTPEDFQNSVNALTHLMINKQVKYPATSYGVPVTDSPEHVKKSTINALVNMLIGLDKREKQDDKLAQIVEYMHKKKMHQEQQTLVAQLQQQMQKEQYKPFIQSQEQAEGLVSLMQQLLEPLKQQGLASFSPQPTAAPVPATTPNNFISHTLPNLSHFQNVHGTSVPESQFDWTPAKPVNNPAPMTYQAPFAPPAPTKPTYLSTATGPHAGHAGNTPEKEGYFIRLGKPSAMKEELPASTVMPKIIHHHLQPVETFSRQTINEPGHNQKHQGLYGPGSHSDIFAPKYEHYIMQHQGEKSKPQLIKLNEGHTHHVPVSHDTSHSSTKYAPKQQHFDVAKLEQEFSNGLNHHRHNHEINDGHEHETHIHTPFMTFNNHEFEEEFLKDFDNMHFKEENVPGYEEVKKIKKPPAKSPQRIIILKKTTKTT